MRNKKEVINLKVKTDLDTTGLREMILLSRAVKNKTRLRIIEFLRDSKFSKNVTDIYIPLRLEQSVASQQLGVLRKAGVVEYEKQGKFHYYSIIPGRLEKINEVLDKITVLANEL